MTLADRLADSQGPLVDQHDGVFLDLDGVVYIGDDAVDGAARAINDLTVRTAYLTNNASRSAADVAEHLRSFGLELADEAVVTAGQVVAAQVAADVGEGARVLLAGADGMLRALEDAGLVVVRSMADHPRALVQGGVVDVRWSELAEASYAVAAGLPWYASNPDLTFPTPRGLAPGNGAMVQAVRTATGGDPVVAGKPARAIFDTARARLGVQNPIMVGDRIDTDIDGAIAAELSSLLVLTGVTDLADLFATPAGHRPSYIAADLSGLRAEHASVEIDGAAAVCEGVTATCADGVIDVDAAAQDVRSLRAAVALAWSIHDASDMIVRPGGTLES